LEFIELTKIHNMTNDQHAEAKLAVCIGVPRHTGAEF
jgi:hypothetical protein